MNNKIITPVVPVWIAISLKGVSRLSYISFPANDDFDISLFNALTKELQEYFSGKRRVFTIPLDIHSGTPFQRAVWNILSSIPYGDVWSYQDVAIKIGNSKAVRAIGQANKPTLYQF